MAMKVSKMWFTAGTVQLQAVLNSCAKKPRLAHMAGSASVTSFVIGSQNTEKP